MDNQSPNSQIPAQFPIPPTEPLPSTQIDPLIQPIIESIPIVTINTPPPIPEEPGKTRFYQNPKFKKSIIIAGIIIITFLLINFIGGRLFPGKSLLNITRTVYIDESNQVSPYDLYTPFPKYEELPEGTPYSDIIDNGCHSPLAPAGVGLFDMCSYRDEKISIAEAQSVLNDIAPGYGIVLVPETLKFSHEENYKGITIKWTDSQPISNNTLSWIKSAIDILPPYFYQDHPVQAIISASASDLGQKHSPESEGAALYQSGLNIFLTSEYAKGSSTTYVVNKEVLVQGLFHEWVHVVQNYEILQTFTVKYLFIPGNASVVMGMSPFNISYAKAAGWIFQGGDFGYATLGTDADAQKQTDYGKTKYVEDMAEAGSYFMLCQNDKISEARIKWWEQTTGTNRNSYCPSKL